MCQSVHRSRFPVQASYTIFHPPSMTGSNASIANVPSLRICSLLTCPCRQPATRSLGEIGQRSTAIIICMSRYVKHGTEYGYPHNSQGIRSGPIVLVGFRLSHSHPWRHKSALALRPLPLQRRPTLNSESRVSTAAPLPLSLKSEPWIMTQNSLSRIMLRYGCSHPRPCKACRSLAYSYSSPSWASPPLSTPRRCRELALPGPSTCRDKSA